MYVVSGPIKKLGWEHDLGSFGMKSPTAKVVTPDAESKISPKAGLLLRFKKPSATKTDGAGNDAGSGSDTGADECECPSCEEQGYVRPEDVLKAEAQEDTSRLVPWWWLLVAGAAGVVIGYGATQLLKK